MFDSLTSWIFESIEKDLLVYQLTYQIDESMLRNLDIGLWILLNITKNPVILSIGQNLFYNFYYMRRTPLSQQEIDVIERLTSKWDSQRQINRITRHSRNTIRKYQRLYRQKIATNLEKALNEYYWDTKVYNIHLSVVWIIAMVIIGLCSLGTYYIFNYILWK